MTNFMPVQIKYIDLKRVKPKAMQAKGALLISGYIYLYEAMVYGSIDNDGLFNSRNLIILN